MAGFFHLFEFGKDASLAAVLVFRLGNFGRDTFQLEMELVVTVCPSAQ
jgi:hypothetical protein